VASVARSVPPACPPPVGAVLCLKRRPLALTFAATAAHLQPPLSRLLLFVMRQSRSKAVGAFVIALSEFLFFFSELTVLHFLLLSCRLSYRLHTWGGRFAGHPASWHFHSLCPLRSGRLQRGHCLSALWVFAGAVELDRSFFPSPQETKKEAPANPPTTCAPRYLHTHACQQHLTNDQGTRPGLPMLSLFYSNAPLSTHSHNPTAFSTY